MAKRTGNLGKFFSDLFDELISEKKNKLVEQKSGQRNSDVCVLCFMIRSRPSDPDCGRVRVADKPFSTDFLTPLLPS